MPPHALLDLDDIAGRLAWALALGSVVGFERQWHQKMAGLKTNALVALGAAGFVCFATVAAGGNPSQVSAQIVSGIGFLGAGVIMREGINVHGLNTAATLWCSAMVGSLRGYGMWQAGGVAASLVLGANLALRPIANRLNARVQSGNEVESHYEMTVECNAGAAPSVRTALLQAMRRYHLAPHQLVSQDGPADGHTSITVHADMNCVVDNDVERLLGDIAQLPTVRGTSWQVTRAAPEA
jgi:putative Mg2+ transporter-C (MgtC) family protein